MLENAAMLKVNRFGTNFKTKQKNRVRIQPQIIGHRRGQNGREQRQQTDPAA